MRGPYPIYVRFPNNQAVPLIRPCGAPSPQGEGVICPINCNLSFPRLSILTRTVLDWFVSALIIRYIILPLTGIDLIKVSLGPALASNTPPACCIKSVRSRSYLTINNPQPRWGCGLFGAADRDRTGTLFRARDFKSLVSACSTTAANMGILSQARALVKSPVNQMPDQNRQVPPPPSAVAT